MKKFTGEDFSSDEETTQKPASDDESALIHHPFKVKEAAIVMDIKVGCSKGNSKIIFLISA